MMRTKKLIVFGSAVALLTLAACSSESSGDPTGAAAPGGDLVVARANEPSGLVASQAYDNAAIWTVEELYETLVQPTVDGKGVEPALATKWTQSPDKLSWTFTLRDGLKFSNGTPITSADVKFSIETYRDIGPGVDSAITKVTTPDAKTIVFTTASPSALIPAAMAMYVNAIIPKDYGGKSVEAFSQEPIGSGPFAFDHWTKGTELKLVKNKNYWDPDKPKLDSVTFTLVPDSNTRATQLAGGQIHINADPALSTIDSLKKQSGLEAGTFPSTEVDFLAFNTARKPLGDVNVRRAIAQAINKDAIVSSVLFGHGTPASTFLSPAFWAHLESSEPAFDLAAAKATLAKSAFPDGFTSTLTTAAGNQNASSAAQLIQADLSKIGVKLKLKTLDPSALYEARENGNYDMVLGRYTSDFIDPDDIAKFAGTDIQGGNMLYTGFRSDELTALANSASVDQDQNSRKASYAKMQQIILDQAPYVPLYYAPFVFSWSDKVRDFHPAVTGNYFLRNVSLAGS